MKLFWTTNLSLINKQYNFIKLLNNAKARL